MNDAVEEFCKQWLLKAQEDWDAVEMLISQENAPAGVVCFHCQQHVEKLIKAVLVKQRVEFPKTHDILRLIELAQDILPGLRKLSRFADDLSAHGVDTRYPSDVKIVDKAEMNRVVEIARKFQEVILDAI